MKKDEVKVPLFDENTGRYYECYKCGAFSKTFFAPDGNSILFSYECKACGFYRPSMPFFRGKSYES